MNTIDSKLTTKRILFFWLPLESTWLMMAMEGPLMSAIIARMAYPKFNLAAFGVAFSFLMVLEAPLMMIISATTALVIDRNSFLKMRRFTFVLIGIITVMIGITVLPPVFYFLSQKLIGLPDYIARLTYGTLLISTPIPSAVGYRRFYQGVLIRHNQTRFVALGTAIRLIGITSLGLLLYRFSILEGAWIGATILLFAVTLEAVLSRFLAGGIIHHLLSKPEIKEGVDEAPLTYRAIFNFYLPLALTSLLALGVQPAVTFFVGKSRMAIESLAVLPVISGLIFLFMSCGMSFHDVVIALVGNNIRNLKTLRKFALGLGVVIVGLLVGIGFTSISYFWFHKISGLSVELTQFALTPTKLMTVMPGLWMVSSFQRSVLTSTRHTAPTTLATGIELLIVLSTLFVAIVYLDFIGAVAAATAFLLGRTGGILYLIRPFSKVVKTFQ